MGEKSYDVGHKYIQFNEESDFACLCTFPDNDGDELGIDRIKSLALFGAVARLVLDGYYDQHGEYIYIPDDVPGWILRDIQNLKE